jgi:uncharacterized protein YoxC
MIMTIFIFVGKAAGSAALDAVKNAVLGIEYQDVTVEDWAKTAALAIFAGQSLRPELSFEKKAELRFNELQRQIDEVKQDINELRSEMSAFKWKVETKFLDDREETLWQEMLNLDADADAFYDQMSDIGKSTSALERKRQRASELAANIISKLRSQVTNTRTRLLGADVGAGNERVRGFIEIWREQALRDADTGWDGDRLSKIYGLLESKFTRALLIQLKCVRLLMEAYETQHAEGDSQQDALAYYSDAYHPILKREVEGFRDMIESLAVNITPLPTGSLLPLKVPDEVAGMLAGLDMFTSQALGGKLSDSGAQAGRRLPEAPAIASCFGRVIVPSTRWIRRAPGSKEAARVTLTTPSGQKVSVKGALEVRAVKYTPYENDKGATVHKGYQIQVGNDQRDMDKMLVAHFTPSDVLPGGIAGPEGAEPQLLDAALETADGGEVLAQTKAYVFPVKVGESKPLTVPYGAFTMSFTGGAGVRGI